MRTTTDLTRSIIFAVVGLAIAATLFLSSCSPIRRLENIHTTEAGNIAETYYKMVLYNPDNNNPKEVDSITAEVKLFLKTH